MSTGYKDESSRCKYARRPGCWMVQSRILQFRERSVPGSSFRHSGKPLVSQASASQLV